MKAEWGMMMTGGSGKLGFHVASKNRGGAYVRTKVKPANPRTTYQQNVRSVLSTNSQAWRGLTEDQRVAWNSATTNFPKVKNGRTYFPSGAQLYNELNTNLVLAGHAVISDPPLPEEMPEIALTDLACDVSSMTFTITSDNATVPMGFTYMVEAIAPISPGRFNVSNRYRVIGPATLAMNTDNMYTEFVAKFGLPIAGQKTAARAYLINNTTGQKSVPTAVTTIITA